MPVSISSRQATSTGWFGGQGRAVPHGLPVARTASCHEEGHTLHHSAPTAVHSTCTVYSANLNKASLGGTLFMILSGVCTLMTKESTQAT